MKAKLFWALLLTPVVALADWQVMWFTSWHILWLGFPVVGVGMLVAGRLRSRPSVTTLGVALMFSGVIGGALALYLNRNQAKANTDKGDQVVAALKNHWDARGSYPESLAELVPDFLGHLPIPSIGVLASGPWMYLPSEEVGGFSLGYRAMSGVALVHGGGKWLAVPFQR